MGAKVINADTSIDDLYESNNNFTFCRFMASNSFFNNSNIGDSCIIFNWDINAGWVIHFSQFGNGVRIRFKKSGGWNDWKNILT